jgi:hypothetical protein
VCILEKENLFHMTEITNEEDKKEQNHYIYAICNRNGREQQNIIPVYSRTFERDINNVLTDKCDATEKERILRSFRAQASGRLSDSSQQKQILRIEIPVTYWPGNVIERRNPTGDS